MEHDTFGYKLCHFFVDLDTIGAGFEGALGMKCAGSFIQNGANALCCCVRSQALDT
ncbi:MAG: hypothetical protein ABJ226_03450 [Roseobacter sp.]